MSSKRYNIKKVNIPFFKKVKGITSSKNYIITFTGKKANIFNKNLELLHTIYDLYYVYKGYISPDESKILLVSNSNRFYVYSLDTFELLQKYTIKGRLDYNLEGQGAWDFDGENFLINATDKNTLTSCVLYFSPNSEQPIKELEFQNYRFSILQRIEQLNKHLLVGSNLRDEHKEYLVFMQGDYYDEYAIENFDDDFVVDVEYNQILNRIIIYGSDSSIICNTKGEFVQPINIERIIRDNAEILNDWLNELELSKTNKEKMLEKIFDFLGTKNLSSYENINKLVYSNNFNHIYVATSNRFIIYDRKEENIIFSKDVPFGVYDILEVCKDKIILLTWDNILIYEIEKIEGKTDNGSVS